MVKIFHTIDGFGKCGTALSGSGTNGRAPGWKPSSRGGGSPSLFIIPKTEKNFQINIEPHINTMQYIRETYIKCVKIHIYAK